MIHTKLPFSKYCDLDAVNASTAKVFQSDCPARYNYLITHPRPDSAAFSLGRCVHSLILEPTLVGTEYAVLDEQRKAQMLADAQEAGSKAKSFSKALATYKEWAAEVAPAEIMDEDEWTRAIDMRDAVMAMPEYELIKEAQFDGMCEVSIEAVYEAEAGDIPIKGRMDCWHQDSGTVIDVKTCQSAKPHDFGSAAWKFGYLFSAGWYRILSEIEGKRFEKFVMVAVENTEPHLTCAYEIPPANLRWGEEIARSTLERIAQCRADDKWPGYPSQYLDLPGYAEQIISEDTETFPPLPDPF